MARTTREKANNGEYSRRRRCPYGVQPPSSRSTLRYFLLRARFYTSGDRAPSPVVNFVVSVAIDTISRRRDAEFYCHFYFPGHGTFRLRFPFDNVVFHRHWHGAKPLQLVPCRFCAVGGEFRLGSSINGWAFGGFRMGWSGVDKTDLKKKSRENGWFRALEHDIFVLFRNVLNILFKDILLQKGFFLF